MIPLARVIGVRKSYRVDQSLRVAAYVSPLSGKADYSFACASNGRKPPPSALYVASSAVAVCVSLSAS